MIDNYSRLVQQIEQRARRLQGVRVAGIGLASLGSGTLLVVISYRLGVLSLTRPLLMGLLLLPVLGALLLYLLGRRKDPSLPRLLLQIDLFFGTGERLSSLHELRRRGSGSPFRDRLETAVQAYPRSWKRALPLGRLHSGSIAGGGLTLLAASLLIAFSPPLSTLPEEIANGAVEIVAEREQASPAEDRPAPPPILGKTDPAASPRAERKEGADHRLEDVLSYLWHSPAAEAVLFEGDGGLSDLLAAQQEMARALADLLSRIEERMAQEEGSGLTAEERHALGSLAERLGGGSPLRQALRSLAGEGDAEAVSERLQEIRDLAQSLQADRRREAPAAGAPIPEEEGDRGEAVAWAPPLPSEEEEESDISEGSRRAASAEESDAQPQLPTEGDADRVGDEEGGLAGEEGTLGSGDLRPEHRPSFLPRDLAGAIGEQGGFQKFVTKGVPFEQLSVGDQGEVLLVVDYETLRALLAGRAIPAGRKDVVRAYFEAISESAP